MKTCILLVMILIQMVNTVTIEVYNATNDGYLNDYIPLYRDSGKRQLLTDTRVTLTIPNSCPAVIRGGSRSASYRTDGNGYINAQFVLLTKNFVNGYLCATMTVNTGYIDPRQLECNVFVPRVIYTFANTGTTPANYNGVMTSLKTIYNDNSIVSHWYYFTANGNTQYIFPDFNERLTIMPGGCPLTFSDGSQVAEVGQQYGIVQPKFKLSPIQSFVNGTFCYLKSDSGGFTTPSSYTPGFLLYQTQAFSAPNQYYNNSIVPANIVDCLFKRSNKDGEPPAYTLKINVIHENTTFISKPVIYCKQNAETLYPGITANINKCTGIAMNSTYYIYSCVIMLEDFIKCVDVNTFDKFIGLSSNAKFSIQDSASMTSIKNSTCPLNINITSTGTSEYGVYSGTTMFKSTIDPIVWMDNGSMKLAINTCITFPDNKNSFLFSPIASITAGDGYDLIVDSVTTPACQNYQDQVGCCQNWVFKSDVITTAKVSWTEEIRWTLNSLYLPLNGKYYYTSVDINELNPKYTGGEVDSQIRLNVTFYNDNSYSYPINHVYNGGWVYSKPSLNGNDLLVLTINKINVCYSSSTNVTITSCSDEAAVVGNAYSIIPGEVSENEAKIWQASVSAGSFRSEKNLQFRLPPLGPQAGKNNAIVMIVRFTYSFTKYSPGLTKKSLANNAPVQSLRETIFTVGCGEGELWDFDAEQCVTGIMNNDKDAAAISFLLTYIYVFSIIMSAILIIVLQKLRRIPTVGGHKSDSWCWFRVTCPNMSLNSNLSKYIQPPTSKRHKSRK